MKLVYTLTAALLLSGSLLLAQDAPSQGGSRNNVQSAMKGCVARTSNGYVLTTEAGSQYMLVSDHVPLDGFLGKEVDVIGNVNATAGAPGSPDNGGTASSIQVTSVTKVDDQCAGANNGH